MRVPANHGVGAGIDHAARQLPLPWVGFEFIFPTPVHDGKHQVGSVHAARRHDVGHHLLILAPGHTRQVGPGLETARVKLVVTQYRNAQPFALEDQRRVGLFQVQATADLRQTSFI